MSNFSEVLPKQKTFPDYHNDFMDNIISENFEIEEVAACQDKRAFGLKKYGDSSFQSSFENAMAVDTVQHLREELIDAINYTTHEIFKATIAGNSTLNLENILADLSHAINLLYDYKSSQ